MQKNSKYKGVLQNIGKNYIQNDICLKHLALFGGPQRIFKIDPDRNKGAKLTPSAATLPEVTPDQEAKRWVSLLSGELDTHPLPAKRYKPGQYVVIFEKDMPNFRFGRVATPPAESSGSGSD